MHRQRSRGDSASCCDVVSRIESGGAAARLCHPSSAGGGSADDYSFVRFYVDHGVSVEVQRYPSGDRCMCSSACLESDQFRLFGDRAPTNYPFLSKHNISQRDTQLEVLGWELDWMAMTISLTEAKVATLRGHILKWPRCRRYALESEVRELVGTLLYASEVA